MWAATDMFNLKVEHMTIYHMYLDLSLCKYGVQLSRGSNKHLNMNINKMKRYLLIQVNQTIISVQVTYTWMFLGGPSENIFIENKPGHWLTKFVWDRFV